jgi:hypothetical protein
MKLKRNLISLREMELTWLGLGIPRVKRMRMTNVNVTNNVKINVREFGRDNFRGPTRECLNFTITILKKINEQI